MESNSSVASERLNPRIDQKGYNSDGNEKNHSQEERKAANSGLRASNDISVGSGVCFLRFDWFDWSLGIQNNVFITFQIVDLDFVQVGEGVAL
jgi:hypothetical protein